MDYSWQPEAQLRSMTDIVKNEGERKFCISEVQVGGKVGALGKLTQWALVQTEFIPSSLSFSVEEKYLSN